MGKGVLNVSRMECDIIFYPRFQGCLKEQHLTGPHLPRCVSSAESQRGVGGRWQPGPWVHHDQPAFLMVQWRGRQRCKHLAPGSTHKISPLFTAPHELIRQRRPYEGGRKTCSVAGSNPSGSQEPWNWGCQRRFATFYVGNYVLASPKLLHIKLREKIDFLTNK